MRQHCNGVIFHLIEVLENFAITSRLENCWEVGVRDENLHDDQCSERVERDQDLHEGLPRVAHLESHISQQSRAELLPEGAVMCHFRLCH